jgi:hypothetical protein
MNAPEPTPGTLSFSLGPFPVRVRPSFWLVMAIFGGLDSLSISARLVTFVLAAFVGVLVHELGHALTGRMFGNTSTSYSGEADRLYSIDPNTAISTPIGAGIGFDNVFALGFTAVGKLYGVSNSTHQLLEIDTSLGTAGVVAPVAPQTIFDIASRPEDGTTFAVNAFTNELFKLDINTGATTLVGTHTVPTHNMVGLAFGPAVPEPATLSILVFGAAIVSIRRRR